MLPRRTSRCSGLLLCSAAVTGRQGCPCCGPTSLSFFCMNTTPAAPQPSSSPIAAPGLMKLEASRSAASTVTDGAGCSSNNAMQDTSSSAMRWEDLYLFSRFNPTWKRVRLGVWKVDRRAAQGSSCLWRSIKPFQAVDHPHQGCCRALAAANRHCPNPPLPLTGASAAECACNLTEPHCKQDRALITSRPLSAYCGGRHQLCTPCSCCRLRLSRLGLRLSALQLSLSCGKLLLQVTQPLLVCRCQFSCWLGLQRLILLCSAKQQHASPDDRARWAVEPHRTTSCLQTSEAEGVYPGLTQSGAHGM